mmetsp:Transcript_20348/g.36193  ORF Transcript_20348/g.36193 Transcript_20348/m.36193 type:complete len:299 (+) Transcript_20348:90-986(+)|eukprot:CAMPEP_0184542604 /NCGR_PEP_ID=MMETSP0199_2-20130426/2238_1 /TAXON_ID=1112570 /ORGANISM="Thraustochytrium sp., Strain LLF1b" /LENGTH=298 /DNA_ID=CAMNT_0026936461 /DNA_START=90 /DNA_END=986 /DNA_ORIENTATION=-
MSSGKGKYGAIPSTNGANGINRNLGTAHLAYQLNDRELSIKAHKGKKSHADEGHREDGDFIKSVVYGGLDGVLTAFAIVSGAAGGNLSVSTVLILGISNIAADAIAMGVGDAVSTIAYNEHVAHERRRECWEFDNYPEGEVEEMIELYEQRGLPLEKADVVVKTMAKYRDFFIDVMMAEELKLKVPDEDDNPYMDGFITFASFLIFGTLPLLGYIFVPLVHPTASQELLFLSACLSTMMVLFGLGTFKSRFSTQSWYRSGLEFLVLGSAAAATSYFIGAFVRDIAEDLLDSPDDLPVV